jgi:formylglycine-generating enzyme required for sulfatase activity
VSGRDLDPRSIASCVASKDERLPLAAPDEPLRATSLVGSWAHAPPCAPTGDRQRICIPGGAFVFGDVDLDPQTTEFPVRERIARVDRFWLDRTEVTVGAYRAALAAGFVPPAPVRVNDDPLTADPVDGCSFTTEPRDREALALTCVPWQTARAYCMWSGGDLPTELRWEYVTARAGKPAETTFAWGDDEPTCDRASFGRAYVPPAPGFCQSEGSGPLVVGRPAGDVIPLGVMGLAGGVSEWMLDAAAPLDADCWRDAPLEDGACLRDDTRRSVRGGTWAGPPPLLVSAVRRSAAEDTPVASIGFRCAYDAP